MKALKISNNKKYLMQGNKPFFWLGDTAWLIFHKLTESEAFTYLENRAEKGFNVIQAVLVYATPNLRDINKMYIPNCDINSEEYWAHCDKIIKKAEELGIYMALLPSWGSLVKHKIINETNAESYCRFLAKRYKNYTNIIWVLGGDIKPIGFESLYNQMGEILKLENPDKLIAFHPFGRCASSEWFSSSEWLDINMFQSGHRRYDQASLGKWDDNQKSNAFYGEDNWRYVIKDHSRTPLKPTLDAEPSYEWILQGLHDQNEPYWTADDVRSYAYWSVFAGACGHTYGDNSIMQFYSDNVQDIGSYGVLDYWQVAIHHEGSGQMKYLAELMNSVDFTEGEPLDELLISGQKEKHNRIAVFGSKDFLFVYDRNGNDFELNLNDYIGCKMWWMSPANGIKSYIGTVDKQRTFKAVVPKRFDSHKDILLIIKRI